MPLGTVAERLAERITQAIGLAVKEGLHKGTTLSPFQVYLNVAEGALELVNNGLQRMPVTCPVELLIGCPRQGHGSRACQGELGRPIGTKDQDAAARQPPSTTEQKGER